jgi:hypothetical protein
LRLAPPARSYELISSGSLSDAANGMGFAFSRDQGLLQGDRIIL